MKMRLVNGVLRESLFDCAPFCALHFENMIAKRHLSIWGGTWIGMPPNGC
jgi:hypothetical protein